MMILVSILVIVLMGNIVAPAHSTKAACTVTLMKGASSYTTLTESSSGAGVVLPEMPDTADWHFIGWSETNFQTVYTKPEIIEAGSTYRPKHDITLWAAYRYTPVIPDEYVEELNNGDYLYVNSELEIALTGVPSKEGTMNYHKKNKYDEQQVYHIDFASPDTAYITHKPTNTPIGYASKKMAAKASPWLVYHDGEETLFYTKIGKDTYVLWLNILDSYGNTYAGLIKAQPASSPMSLMVAKEKPQEVYTCYPDAESAVGNVQPDSPAWQQDDLILPFGNYRLHVRNGHKYLQLEK